jgi:hypothetical protein
MPWKDQLRLGWRCLRWLFWPAELKTWANIATWVILVTMTLAVSYQLWLPLLAAFFISVPVQRLGRKRHR